MPVADPHSADAPDAALPSHARVVIVGAGQAGLSVAHHLARRGLTPGEDLVVLDRSPAAGGAWQFRWESLRLGTAHRVNDLPGMRELGLSFDTADRGRAARDVVGEYYAAYEQHFGLQVFRPVTVTGVREAAPDVASGRLRVEYLRGVVAGVMAPSTTADAARGAITTAILVNATGTWGAPIRPYVPGIETFAGRQLATPEYRSAAEFSGLRVIVVGGGTSAVGFVLELEGIAASTTWVTRRPVSFAGDEPGEASASIEGRLAAVAQQNDAAAAGRVLPSIISGTGLPATARNLDALRRGVLVARPMFTSIEQGGVRFADGSFEPADAIIWATGFRSELGHLDPLGLREPGGGVAAAEGRALRDPRVFLAGYGPQASTIGADRAGRLVAMQVLEALEQRDAEDDPGHPEPA
ncbi:pyridine nucleotide-disulfide oxidoreductase [Subtercola boreus]|uniref:Pyridine nucleotide-disulfide oxidoreductase n=1 Tax=Subtercola boreus TaxID=120213 RepID=A0A3E0VJH7_9MICO|nr:FAD-dependent oxidoreductase [Subtercola boreus]RFA10112.1 pyridine nucleotide-disulfide oxidoreductase [Subtercola boreus]TQL52733.1 cation diffusion facilitator CzcD-associated flavoprotein CzcO [Subtercola boreus]